MGLSGVGRDNLGRSQDPADPFRSPGVFRRGGLCGADVDLLIGGKNLQNGSDILSANPKLSADILSVEHNTIRARFRHVSAKATQAKGICGRG